MNKKFQDKDGRLEELDGRFGDIIARLRAQQPELTEADELTDRIMARIAELEAVNEQPARKAPLRIWQWMAAASVALVIGLAAMWNPATEQQGTESSIAEEIAEAGSAASTTQSVTPYGAKRSVGTTDTEEPSVRPGVRLHQTAEARTVAESYAKAHDVPAQGTDNPHDKSWGYRKNRGSAIYASSENSEPSEPFEISEHSEISERAAYRSPALYIMRTACNVEEVMMECERTILEEEFREKEVRTRTVSL